MTAFSPDLPDWHDGLPAAAEAELKAAAEAFADDTAARAHLGRAEALAPGHPAVLLGWYKLHFYKHRLAAALPYAAACVAWAAGQLGLPADWRAVTADPRFTGLEVPVARFWLFALTAWGYLQVRLGALDQGRAALAKVAALDPADRIGAGRLLAVVEAGPSA